MDHIDASQHEEELEVLKSIYPDYISSIEHNALRLLIPLEFGTPRKVLCTDAVTQQTADVQLKHLPPILLSIGLPPGYPSEECAVISSIFVTCSWLRDLVRLRETLQSMFILGEGILYQWVEFIRSGDVLDALGMVSGQGVIKLTCTSPHTLAPLLQAFDSKVSSDEFSQTSYSCSICLASLKGAKCIQLACSHVFCRPCLLDFWGLCIKEGDVGRVGCPDPECVKKGNEAKEEDVRRVVSDDEIKRWKWLLAKREVEKDPGVVHCPRSMCQAAVPKQDDRVTDESAWARFRTCPECMFSFCSFCKSAWHGTVNPCRTSATNELVDEYLGLPEGSPERTALERRFGKIFIMRLVKEREEEEANRKWLSDSTTTCPGCQVHVEKSVGCNHITCAKCGQHFCYRCGSKLEASNPYVHFSTKDTICFGKLFEFQHTDDDWQPI